VYLYYIYLGIYLGEAAEEGLDLCLQALLLRPVMMVVSTKREGGGRANKERR
jgi:hypothetical protein